MCEASGCVASDVLPHRAVDTTADRAGLRVSVDPALGHRLSSSEALATHIDPFGMDSAFAIQYVADVEAVVTE